MTSCRATAATTGWTAGTATTCCRAGSAPTRWSVRAGVDFASYASSLSGITASLVAPGSNTGEAAGDTYISIEGLIGTAFADILIGDGNSSFLVGGAAGDTLNGGDGLDFVSYRTSAIGITASLANPAANTGDAAGDSYFSIEGLAGSQLADQLYGDSGDNVLVGEGGGDFLSGGAGNDTASYRTAVAGVTADLTANQGFSGDAAGDSFSSIENSTARASPTSSTATAVSTS